MRSSTIAVLLAFLSLFAIAAGLHLRMAQEDPSAPPPSTEVRAQVASSGEPLVSAPQPAPADVQGTALPEAVELPWPDGTDPALASVPAPVPAPETSSQTQAEPQSAPQSEQAELSTVPDAPADLPPEPEDEPEPAPRVVSGEVARGDTLEKLLAGVASREEVNALLAASRKVYSLAALRAGQPYTLTLTPDGALESFAYEIDRTHRVTAVRSGKGFVCAKELLEYETRVQLVTGTIRHSLFKAVTDSGESASLASTMAEIFGSEINFIKDVRANDHFALLVEKRYRGGEFRHYGPVLAARFVNQGKTYEGFRFNPGQGGSEFFTAKGESLRKTLLMAPLAVTRVTSGYSLSRRHPVFFDNRPHEGVDYGAPAGTPIRAVGSGEVTKAGWGNGFGNMVIIRHGSSLESVYSHLSRFAPGIKAGVKVRQGQTIGAVGATGVATGPHLDFRLKQNGRYVDPTKVVNPRAGSVPANRQKVFQARVAELRAGLDGKTVRAPGR